MIELLAPVGDFECLKAAVQNGADSVYFGSNFFSARAFAHNFNEENLKKAIEYAKIRGVKTNLTLNTLIKDDEFNDAIMLAAKAYEYGIDAIIVQDLGLARTLIKLFPDLPIHGSTQMTVHNLNGALELQDLGFKRVVLARELSLDEIKYICKNTKVEIECFVHGALCISYSGQCLFSSMLGGRSGNRGKCAGPCRLPYELLENEKTIDSGYLLSTRDLCGLDYLPDFVDAGVKCLKIEGRMKSPEYVATVTKIYRKYLDLAQNKKEDYKVSNKDKKTLMQVFNRGMTSSGHLDNSANKKLVYKEKPNNMGLYIGTVKRYNKNKGYITLELEDKIEIGDTIAIENRTGSYKISELMENGKNIKETTVGQTVTIGRIKGIIQNGYKIYRLASKELTKEAKESYQGENRKVALNCTVTIKKKQPVSIHVTSCSNLNLYKNLSITCNLDFIPGQAKTRPLDKQTVINQISKTASSPYYFKNIKVDIDDDVFLPKLSILNELRRIALSNIGSIAQAGIHRNISKTVLDKINKKEDTTLKNMRTMAKLTKNGTPKISLLLNIIDENFDYNKLEYVDDVYIPLKFFTSKKYEACLKTISRKFDTYIYMPTIVKGNYKNLFLANAETAVNKYNIQGFVISNICNIKLLNSLFKDLDKYFKIISNYTFNVFNSQTVLELKKLGVSKFTLSPELDKKTLTALCNYNYLQKELIVYGKVPLIHMNYCLLGESNKCYPTCKVRCQNDKTYYLKDRLNMKFEIMPDNIQTVTTLFNSKITSISPKDFQVDFARIDILHETIPEINEIIKTVKAGKKFQGTDYTSGNLNREI